MTSMSLSMHKRVVKLILFIVVMFLFSHNEYKQTHEFVTALTTKRERRLQVDDQNQQQNDNLQQENIDLQLENINLQPENINLQLENINLQLENINLQLDFHLQLDYTNLTDSINSLFRTVYSSRVAKKIKQAIEVAIMLENLADAQEENLNQQIHQINAQEEEIQINNIQINNNLAEQLRNSASSSLIRASLAQSATLAMLLRNQLVQAEQPVLIAQMIRHQEIERRRIDLMEAAQEQAAAIVERRRIDLMEAVQEQAAAIVERVNEIEINAMNEIFGAAHTVINIAGLNIAGLNIARINIAAGMNIAAGINTGINARINTVLAANILQNALQPIQNANHAELDRLIVTATERREKQLEERRAEERRAEEGEQNIATNVLAENTAAAAGAFVAASTIFLPQNIVAAAAAANNAVSVIVANNQAENATNNQAENPAEEQALNIGHAFPNSHSL